MDLRKAFECNASPLSPTQYHNTNVSRKYRKKQTSSKEMNLWLFSGSYFNYSRQNSIFISRCKSSEAFSSIRVYIILGKPSSQMQCVNIPYLPSSGARKWPSSFKLRRASSFSPAPMCQILLLPSFLKNIYDFKYRMRWYSIPRIDAKSQDTTLSSRITHQKKLKIGHFDSRFGGLSLAPYGRKEAFASSNCRKPNFCLSIQSWSKSPIAKIQSSNMRQKTFFLFRETVTAPLKT